jgi:arsenate reductase
MGNQKSALFICVHNSARSQIAETYLEHLGGEAWRVESAGFEPGEINPLVTRVMAEEGFDLSTRTTQSVFDLFKQGKTFQYVITVCSESEEGSCPIFPGMTHRLHVPFPDPAGLQGTEEEKLARLREIRDQIRAMILQFLGWEASGQVKKLGDHWELR